MTEEGCAHTYDLRPEVDARVARAGFRGGCIVAQKRGPEEDKPSEPRASPRLALLLDRNLIVGGAVGEVLLVHVGPATKQLLDRERLDRRELGGVGLQYVGIARSQVVLGDDGLPFR